MERLPDLLRSIREDLTSASAQAEAEAIDSGSEDSPYWDAVDDLNDAFDFVDSACNKLPKED